MCIASMVLGFALFIAGVVPAAYNPSACRSSSSSSSSSSGYGSSSSYNSGYDSGYNRGYNYGYNKGFDTTFISTYNDAYNYGYNKGYNKGYSGYSYSNVGNGFSSYSYESSTYSLAYNAGYNAGYNPSSLWDHTYDYNTGYNTGYNSGYYKGFAQGDSLTTYKLSYNSGFNAGFNSGYNTGHSTYLYTHNSGYYNGFCSGYYNSYIASQSSSSDYNRDLTWYYNTGYNSGFYSGSYSHTSSSYGSSSSSSSYHYSSCEGDRAAAKAWLVFIGLWGIIPGLYTLIFGGLGIATSSKRTKLFGGLYLAQLISDILLLLTSTYISLCLALSSQFICGKNACAFCFSIAADDTLTSADDYDLVDSNRLCSMAQGSAYAIFVFDLLLSICQIATSIVMCSLCCQPDQWEEINAVRPIHLDHGMPVAKPIEAVPVQPAIANPVSAPQPAQATLNSLLGASAGSNDVKDDHNPMAKSGQARGAWIMPAPPQVPTDPPTSQHEGAQSVVAPYLRAGNRLFKSLRTLKEWVDGEESED
ncbi:hypothetical protein GUITHDRAFT_111499 [Guillardia theta CCMP2712]|uniref:MARVEL domain-containing protein n=1 Tax=Guillardia theta (strain CCMP2712) TaxID=905079 RepID=L1J310_GUITC|nr:hypothetical protein GUITHDRAFT_111499 [Guillardia theta CCMP2712]EKX42524.1 hypothetical protein GUITHDRAFT_111499 [Guillardia theta CCMP2712]|eukprot:XP_005829504.1 hypothetical protein GUITHDRAFT_111499 [Guillardia theta CCMP2712]